MRAAGQRRQACAAALRRSSSSRYCAGRHRLPRDRRCSLFAVLFGFASLSRYFVDGTSFDMPHIGGVLTRPRFPLVGGRLPDSCRGPTTGRTCRQAPVRAARRSRRRRPRWTVLRGRRCSCLRRVLRHHSALLWAAVSRAQRRQFTTSLLRTVRSSTTGQPHARTPAPIGVAIPDGELV